MDYILDIDYDNEEFLVSSESVEQPYDDWMGSRYEFEFPNGYGATVCKFYGTYGFESDLWEMALWKDGDIVFEHEFEDDVIGYLCDEEVNDILRNIRNY